MTFVPTAAEPTLTTPPAAPAAGSGLDEATLRRFREEFEASDACRVAQNAVTRTGVNDVALNRAVVTRMDHTFSHVLDDWEVTNQKKSGRCWMFAALNLRWAR